MPIQLIAYIANLSTFFMKNASYLKENSGAKLLLLSIVHNYKSHKIISIDEVSQVAN